MHRRVFVACACLAATGRPGHAQQHPGFGYSGPNSPLHWGGITEHWQACSAGRNQSPLDLDRLTAADLPPLAFDYTTSGAEIVNNTHSLQVNCRPGSVLRVAGHTYKLLQFHFHSPSEHHLEGRDFPLEAHLVHQDGNGDLAVIAVLFEDGPANDLIGSLWASMPGGPGQRMILGNNITAAGLLPPNRRYIRYSGSLTTPPCSEGVLWLVMQDRMTISREQVAAFAHGLGFSNNRPVQPVGARAPMRGRGG